jgi:hypothetical protein
MLIFVAIKYNAIRRWIITCKHDNEKETFPRNWSWLKNKKNDLNICNKILIIIVYQNISF